MILSDKALLVQFFSYLLLQFLGLGHIFKTADYTDKFSMPQNREMSRRVNPLPVFFQIYRHFLMAAVDFPAFCIDDIFFCNIPRFVPMVIQTLRDRIHNNDPLLFIGNNDPLLQVVISCF